MSKDSIFIICLFILLIAFSLIARSQNLHVYQAYSFIEGNIALVKLPANLTDLSYFDGKHFWPHGPLPAILLLPFVAVFKLNFQEFLLKIPLTILNFWLIYKIAQTLKLEEKKSLWLAIFFVFGSVYTPLVVIPFSVYLSQIMGTSAILLALYLFFTRKSWLLVSAYVALSAFCRHTLLLSGIFFAGFLFQRKLQLNDLFRFLIPVVAAIIIMTAYNYQRFENLFDFGFKYRILPSETQKLKSEGLFSTKHIPTNLYYMLIKTPEPVFQNNSHLLKFPYIKTDYWGMSLFLLSPVLFLIFAANFKNFLVKISSLTILIMLIPLVTYYGIGFRQIGYRYALDFFPFLMIILIDAAKKVPLGIIRPLVILGMVSIWFFIIEMLLGI